MAHNVSTKLRTCRQGTIYKYLLILHRRIGVSAYHKLGVQNMKLYDYVWKNGAIKKFDLDAVLVLVGGKQQFHMVSV